MIWYLSETELCRCRSFGKCGVGFICFTLCCTVQQPGLDIFGNKPEANTSDLYECLNCHRRFPTGRYASHLEKCIGVGRTSARAARRYAPFDEKFFSISNITYYFNTVLSRGL
jgi:hypothetical protein